MGRAETIAIIADTTDVRELVTLIREASSLDPVIIPPTRRAPLGVTYARAALGIVSRPESMPAAMLARRLYRVPWIAAVETFADAAPTVLADAAAVIVSKEAIEAAPPVVPRPVAPDDVTRLAHLIADIALAADAVGRSGRFGTSIVPDTWMFLNDRATRAAIRLVPLLGKASQPIHPKHLLDVPWHYWYVDALGADDRVLDVGCGSAAHALHVADRVGSVVGVDIDAVAIAQARSTARQRGIANVEFRLGDLIEDETFAREGKGSFDVVLLLDVLEHVVQRRATLAVIRSLLKPDGKLILSVPNRETPYKRWRRRLGGFAYADPDHKIEYDEGLLAEELHSAGFRIASLARGGYDTPFGGFTSLIGAVSLRAYRALAGRRARLGERHPARATAFRVIAVPRAT